MILKTGGRGFARYATALVFAFTVSTSLVGFPTSTSNSDLRDPHYNTFYDDFETAEKAAKGRSNDDGLKKLSQSLARLEKSLGQPSPEEREALDAWRKVLEPLQDEHELTKIQEVNTKVNARPYVEDIKNWDVNDYWASPVEFLMRGGDCEDFAIAKYFSLRILGVPAERMNIKVVKDTTKFIKDSKEHVAHAILVVDLEDGQQLALDNQSSTTEFVDTLDHYKPLYVVNARGLDVDKVITSKQTRVATASLDLDLSAKYESWDHKAADFMFSADSSWRSFITTPLTEWPASLIHRPETQDDKSVLFHPRDP